MITAFPRVDQVSAGGDTAARYLADHPVPDVP
jgi:hypothetical protein